MNQLTRAFSIGFIILTAVLFTGCDEVTMPQVRSVVGTLRQRHCQTVIVELQNPADTVWGGGRGFLYQDCQTDSTGALIRSSCVTFPAVIGTLCDTCPSQAGAIGNPLVTVTVPLDPEQSISCPPIICTADLPRFGLVRLNGAQGPSGGKVTCGVRID